MNDIYIYLIGVVLVWVMTFLTNRIATCAENKMTISETFAASTISYFGAVILCIVYVQEYHYEKLNKWYLGLTK